MKKAKIAIILFMSLMGITFLTEQVFAEDFYDFNQQEILVTVEKASEKPSADGPSKSDTPKKVSGSSTSGSLSSGRLPQTGETMLFAGTALGVCLIGITVIYVLYKRKQIEGDAT